MMARESSFTIDGGGNVSEWHDAAHNYPDITSRDIVGVPAGVALDRLLGRLTDANGSPGPAALLLSACRDRAETVVSLRGTAPSLHAAQVEAAFDSSAFERSTAGLEVYDTDLSVLRANAAALAMRGRPAARVLRHRVGNLGSRVPLAPFLRKVLDGDETAAQGRIDGHDGHGGSRVFAVTAFQLRDEREVIGAGAVIHDVTEQDRAERAARLLRRAHQEIGTRLDAPGPRANSPPSPPGTSPTPSRSTSSTRSCTAARHLSRRWAPTSSCAAPPSRPPAACAPPTPSGR